MRDSATYLQCIFDKYEIKPSTIIGHDKDSDKDITAKDLIFDFIHTNKKSQREIIDPIMYDSIINIEKKLMIKKLFDMYILIKKISRS